MEKERRDPEVEDDQPASSFLTSFTCVFMVIPGIGMLGSTEQESQNIIQDPIFNSVIFCLLLPKNTTTNIQVRYWWGLKISPENACIHLENFYLPGTG